MGRHRLNETSDLYKAIVESSSYAYVVVNYEGKILFANNTFTTISRYLLEELVDSELAEIAVGKVLISRLIQATKEGTFLKELKTTITPKNGPLIPVSLSVASMTGQMKILFSFRDLRPENEAVKELIEFRQVVSSKLWIGLFEWGIEGPVPKVTEIPPFFDSEDKQANVLEEMAAFYSLNLPHGTEDKDNLGLFGFLPIPRVTDYVALIYTFRIENKNTDERFDGVSYAFIVIAIPKTIEKFFANKQSIVEVIEKNLKDAQEITDIDLEKMQRIKKEIIL